MADRPVMAPVADSSREVVESPGPGNVPAWPFLFSVPATPAPSWDWGSGAVCDDMNVAETKRSPAQILESRCIRQV